MAKGSGKTAAEVRSVITPKINELGFDIWDIEYKKVGADYHLIVTIDNEEGITIDDCELVHRAIDPLLDEADPIEDSYYLEVSSPGVERDIRTPEHFVLCRGENVCVKLYTPVEKRKLFTGILGCDDKAEKITVNENGKVYEFAFADIAKANVAYTEE